jgi:hypothetical protein
MNPGLFKLLLLICMGFGPLFVTAQEEEPQTIKIRRESNLVKAVFDNTEMRLMVIDRFGNPKENKIVSYKLWIKGKGNVQALDGYSNSLTPDMIRTLKKQSKAVKIFFTEISVQEDDGHLVKLPDVIDTWFPDCENCEKGVKRTKSTW